MRACEFALDTHQLAVTRNPRGHGLYERIALAEDLQERLDLLGLQCAVEINLAFNLGFLRQRRLPLLWCKFAEPRKNLAGGLGR